MKQSNLLLKSKLMTYNRIKLIKMLQFILLLIKMVFILFIYDLLKSKIKMILFNN